MHPPAPPGPNEPGLPSPADPGSLLAGLGQFAIRLGLDDTRALLAPLGDPQRAFPSVLVAGTNGKGSTAAFLQQILTAAGYRVGFYTSPHLEHVEERVRIGGRAIAGDRLAALLERVITAAQSALGHPPTYFEAVTAAAFLHFAAERVDLAVLEVGMGGRLDATNVVEPILSVVTDIALDHQAHLGADLTAIAREKAGVFRSERPALVWAQAPEALAALRTAAQAVGAEFESVPELVAARPLEEHGFDGQTVRVTTPLADYHLSTALLGAHQARNLGLAVRAAERLQTLGWRRLGPGAIMRGAALCRWPGRLEPVVVSDRLTVLLDGAHNPAGASSLLEFLDKLESPFDLLFGALAEKDVAGMLVPLARGARRVTLTRVDNARGVPPADLASLLPDREVTAEPDAGEALTRALRDAAPVLLVAGSLYLVGDLRAELRRRFGVPAPLDVL